MHYYSTYFLDFFYFFSGTPLKIFSKCFDRTFLFLTTLVFVFVGLETLEDIFRSYLCKSSNFLLPKEDIFFNN